jgi:cyclopropane fatty-acyl-phospholipid synthase-like methyltransferase
MTMNRRRFLAALPLLAGCSTPGVKLDAPYVSTPDAVVREMLRLAAVGPSDMVYDLGCGDGRIVIAAARDFGARGFGIDIDPRRIEEARAGARSAGVESRTRFAVQDLFKTDFSEATVVTLFLFAELNARLLPKFRAELKPGTRVVSHQFGIGDWQPKSKALVFADGLDHWVHLWVVA